MEQLKSCPFCGGEASCNNRGLNDKNGNPVWWAECRSCGASIEGTENTKSAAIAAWNRRAEQNPQPLTLDELREMDGEPVWIVEYPEWGHWELSEEADDYISDRDPDFYGMKHDDPAGRYGLHVLGWLAYRTKPERSSEQ